jgi:hypothetical protein
VSWEYRVHEQLLPSLRRAGFAVRWTDIVIQHTGYQDPAAGPAKVERNLRLLLLDQAEGPGDPFTLLNLGAAYVQLGRPAEAVPLLQRSLAGSRPGDSIVGKLYAALAGALERLGQRREALAALAQGRARCPDEPHLLLQEAQLRRAAGDLAAAEGCLRQLVVARRDRSVSPTPSPPTPIPPSRPETKPAAQSVSPPLTPDPSPPGGEGSRCAWRLGGGGRFARDTPGGGGRRQAAGSGTITHLCPGGGLARGRRGGGVAAGSAARHVRGRGRAVGRDGPPPAGAALPRQRLGRRHGKRSEPAAAVLRPSRTAFCCKAGPSQCLGWGGCPRHS